VLRTIEAMIDATGQVTLAEPIKVAEPTRALVTILEEAPVGDLPNEAALLSERSLAEGWLGPEANEAWKHLLDLPGIEEVGT